MIVTFFRRYSSRSTNGSNVSRKVRKASFRIAGVLMLAKVRSITLQPSYPLPAPASCFRSEPEEDIVIYTDDLLDGASLVVPRHCHTPVELTAPRYVKSLSKIMCDLADFLCTDPRARSSSHNLLDITHVCSDHREVAC